MGMNWNAMFRLSFLTVFLFMWTLCEIIVIKKQKDKIYNCHVIMEVSFPMWSVCAQLCSRMQICKSINFIALNKTCQVNYAEPDGTMEGLIKSVGNIFIAASTFPKVNVIKIVVKL